MFLVRVFLVVCVVSFNAFSIAQSDVKMVSIGNGSRIVAENVVNGETEMVQVRIVDAGFTVTSMARVFGTDEVRVSNVAVSTEGEVMVAGTFTGVIGFRNIRFEAGINRDVFFVIFDADGAVTAFERFGGDGSETITGVSVTETGLFRVDGVVSEGEMTAFFTVEITASGNVVGFEMVEVPTETFEFNFTHREDTGGEETTDPDGISTGEETSDPDGISTGEETSDPDAISTGEETSDPDGD